MGTWLNQDGLYIKFGTNEAASHSGGEINVEGILRVVTLSLDLTTLSTVPIILNDVTLLDKGIRVERVQIDTITASTTGTTAALNVGLISEDRTTAYNGSTPGQAFVAALANTATATQGLITDLTVSATSAGNQLGISTTKPALLTAATSTGTYTAGFIMVRLYFTVPNV